MSPATADRRYIVLSADGRYVTLSRVFSPSDAEVAGARRRLAAQGAQAWLAVAFGSFFLARPPELEALMPLTPGPATWEAAVSAFRAAHRRMLASGEPRP